jgi:hypothetical protein
VATEVFARHHNILHEEHLFAIAKMAPREQRGTHLDLGKVVANGLLPISAVAGHLFQLCRVQKCR